MTLFYVPQYITTQLSVSGGIDDSQTTGIVLQSITGVDYTKPGIIAVTWSNPLDTSVVEYISYTSINNSTKELNGVTRGVEGYSAKSHVNGASIAWPLSKSHINNINDSLLSVNAGWTDADETWTYVGADDPTFTFKITGVDLTSKYSAGMRIKLTQTTVKYFIITAVAFSTDTTITVYGGTDYDLANASITSPYYSTQKAPQGFPLDPTKWTVETNSTSDVAQNTPTASTWYNIGTTTISIPIGIWNVNYQVTLYENDNSADAECRVTLSNANNSASDADLTCMANFSATGATDTTLINSVFRSKCLVLAAKTSYYLNAMTTVTSATSIRYRGALSPTIIRAVCAYL